MSKKPDNVVISRLFEVKKKINRLKKDDWTWSKAKLGFSDYKYRSFHNLMEKISPILEEEKLMISFAATPFQGVEMIRERVVIFNLSIIFAAPDEPGAQPFAVSMPAISEDKLDLAKAVGKASTYSRRYLLLHALGISDTELTVEEAEVALKKANRTSFSANSNFKKVSSTKENTAGGDWWKNKKNPVS